MVTRECKKRLQRWATIVVATRESPLVQFVTSSKRSQGSQSVTADSEQNTENKTKIGSKQLLHVALIYLL